MSYRQRFQLFSRALTVLAALIAFSLGPARGETLTVVAWAPGYPGTTEQAQPSMDELARGVAAGMGIPTDQVRAYYHPELDLGRERLLGNDVAVAIVPLPILLEYGERLKLQPLLTVELADVKEERWSLVAQKGALNSAADLSGWRVEGLAGYSPAFVRTVLSDWGSLPTDVEIGFNGRVLSVLRKAAKGEPVAALLDAAQTGALERLPFASDLELIVSSEAMPSSYVCVVGGRLDEAAAGEVSEALLTLGDSEDGRELLSAIRLTRFGKMDAAATAQIEELRKRWRSAP